MRIFKYNKRQVKALFTSIVTKIDDNLKIINELSLSKEDDTLLSILQEETELLIEIRNKI